MFTGQLLMHFPLDSGNEPRFPMMTSSSSRVGPDVTCVGSSKKFKIRESHHHIVDYCGGDEEAANDLVKKFLDRSLTSRLGIRLLVTHHLLLRQQIRTDKVP